MTKKQKKATHGGKRDGAGRKPIQGNSTMNAGIFVRCHDEQKDAIEGYVEKLSGKREAKGLSKVAVSTWLRELALKESGNEHLGMAAQSRKAAEDADSIV